MDTLRKTQVQQHFFCKIATQNFIPETSLLIVKTLKNTLLIASQITRSITEIIFTATSYLRHSKPEPILVVSVLGTKQLH